MCATVFSLELFHDIRVAIVFTRVNPPKEKFVVPNGRVFIGPVGEFVQLLFAAKDLNSRRLVDKIVPSVLVIAA